MSSFSLVPHAPASSPYPTPFFFNSLPSQASFYIRQTRNNCASYLTSAPLAFMWDVSSSNLVFLYSHSLRMYYTFLMEIFIEDLKRIKVSKTGNNYSFVQWIFFSLPQHIYIFSKINQRQNFHICQVSCYFLMHNSSSFPYANGNRLRAIQHFKKKTPLILPVH